MRVYISPHKVFGGLFEISSLAEASKHSTKQPQCWQVTAWSIVCVRRAFETGPCVNDFWSWEGGAGLWMVLSQSIRDENFQMLESKKKQQKWVNIHRNILETAQKKFRIFGKPQMDSASCSILGRTPHLFFTSIGFPDKAVLLLQLAILAKKSTGRWTFKGKNYVWIAENFSPYACGCIMSSSNFRGDL